MKYIKDLLKIALITLLAAGSVVGVVFLSSRGRGSGEPKGTYHSPTRYAMDTTLDITIQGESTSKAEEDTNAACALAKQIEAKTSRFDPDSDTSKINAAAGAAPVNVGKDTLYLVQKALEFSGLTGGAFDITVAPVAELWGFYDQEYRVASDEELAAVLPLVGYRDVSVDAANGTVMLARTGMQIDLGGIAKGYAVQRMCDLLRERGVEHALVNFGGAVGAVGRRSDGKKWVIGIKDPRRSGGELAGELEIEDCYVSSSGDYERYFIEEGKRYFHIFDPATGRNPAGVIGTTVVGPDSTVADILSTALVVMGAERGMNLMNSQEGFDALTIDGTGKTFSTPNMEKKYDLNIPGDVL
jgi:thiamine biosynthesis lipoprotein